MLTSAVAGTRGLRAPLILIAASAVALASAITAGQASYATDICFNGCSEFRCTVQAWGVGDDDEVVYTCEGASLSSCRQFCVRGDDPDASDHMCFLNATSNAVCESYGNDEDNTVWHYDNCEPDCVSAPYTFPCSCMSGSCHDEGAAVGRFTSSICHDQPY